jgi:hemoglobin
MDPEPFLSMAVVIHPRIVSAPSTMGEDEAPGNQGLSALPRLPSVRDSGTMTTGADLSSRADIEALLWRFYGVALEDEALDQPFAELRAGGLAEHIPTMCDFWETVLFGAGLYRGSALTVHRDLHRRAPVSASHFVRWLTLWRGAVDEMYRGPVAERAKVQAARIAWSMNRRLSGVDAQELRPPRGPNHTAEPGARDRSLVRLATD